MINLAPDHKQGLNLTHPLILAGGTASYGECLPPGLTGQTIGQWIGALVVGPVMAQSRSGNQNSRIATGPGTMILDTGGQNRGIRAAIRRFSRLWQSFDCPVILQVGDRDPLALAETLEALQSTPVTSPDFIENPGDLGIDALELLLPDSAPAKNLAALVGQARAHYAGPLLVRLPLVRAGRIASVLLDAGADVLVVGEPPSGALPRTNWVVQGRLYGPGTFPLMLQELMSIRAAHPHAGLIACGGIHSAEMAQHALNLGATAVALDSAVWIDPGIIFEVSQALRLA